jgi:Transglutaminase-like superfamily
VLKEKKEMSTEGINARIAQLQLDQVGRVFGSIPSSMGKLKTAPEINNPVEQPQNTDQNDSTMRNDDMSNRVSKSALTTRFELFQQQKRHSKESIQHLAGNKQVTKQDNFPHRASMGKGKKPPPPPPPITTKQPTQSKPIVTKGALPPALPRRVAPPQLPPRPKNTVITNPSLPELHCLFCQDFSAVDEHAAKFPRHQVKSLDKLAKDLTSPFPSMTDKARAIFVWLHHNIAYDTEAFFSGNLKASSPSSTLLSGLAVCEGYAGLFGDISSRSGVEAKVVSGFGKGFGYICPTGTTVPKFESNHAWNAVRLDTGEWHLIDACWGAGYLDVSKNYVKKFNPTYFCSSTEEFGLDHFPKEMDMQLIPAPRSWGEYIMTAERPKICSTSETSLFQINRSSLLPQTKNIPFGWNKFVVEKICSKDNGGSCVLMMNSPSGRRTVMKRRDGGEWECSVDIEEEGPWYCCIAVDSSGSAVKLPGAGTDCDPYRYGWKSLCGWECV